MVTNEITGDFLNDEAELTLDTDYYGEELDTGNALHNIKTLISRVQDSCLTNWLGVAYQKKIKEKAAAHQADIKRYTDELASLKQKLEKLEDEKKQIHQAISKQTSDAVVLRSRLKAIQEEVEGLLLEKEQNENILQVTCEQVAQLKDAVEARTQSSENCAKSLDREVSFFKDRLGLQLKRVSGERLQFIFTCIDDKDPSRPFCFCVKINPDKTYTISDCQPEVPELDKLTEQLQSTNNFRSFVISIRKNFQDLVM